MTDDELTDRADDIAWSFPRKNNAAWANDFARRASDLSAFARECCAEYPTISAQYQDSAAFAYEQALMFRLACLYSY